MTEYDDFVIVPYNWSREITYYDGHRNEGTGEYEHGTSYKIYHKEVKKSEKNMIKYTQSVQEAKQFIDDFLTKKSRKKISDHRKNLKLLQKQAKELESQLQTLYDDHVKLGEQCRKLENIIKDFERYKGPIQEALYND